MKDASYAFWNGIFVPAQTPRDIIAKLHDETQKALLVPSVQERLAKIGQDPLPMYAGGVREYFHDDVSATAKLMQQAGVQKIDQ